MRLRGHTTDLKESIASITEATTNAVHALIDRDQEIWEEHQDMKAQLAELAARSAEEQRGQKTTFKFTREQVQTVETAVTTTEDVEPSRDRNSLRNSKVSGRGTHQNTIHHLAAARVPLCFSRRYLGDCGQFDQNCRRLGTISVLLYGID
jgi:hypothetical protein